MGTQFVRSCGPFLVTLVLSALDATGWLVIGLIYTVAACVAPLSRRAEAAHQVTAPQAAPPQPTPTKQTVPHNA